MRITQDQIDYFVDPDDPATPAMSVSVIKDGLVVDMYLVPAGFQLDLYVSSLFPNFLLNVEVFPEKMVVSVVHNFIPVEIHEGLFGEENGSH